MPVPTFSPSPLLTDRFGRRLNYLRLSVTDRCNLRCRYCMPEAGVAPLDHAEVLSYEEMLRLARIACELGVQKIRVTGGEPLVRRGIVDFIGQLSRLPQNPEIVLTTNGLRLKELAGPLKQAGLRRVNVSLDTLRPERFRQITRREGLEEVLEGLQAATAVGLGPVKINMVPILGVNDDEIVAFARMTLEHPWEVRFIEFMPISSDLDYAPEQRMPVAAMLKKLATLGPLSEEPRSASAGPARLFRLPGAQASLGIIPAVSNHFCDECNRLRITSNGKIRPCLFSAEEVDLKPLLRGGGSDEQLAGLFLGAADAKPEGHQLDTQPAGPGDKRMQEIGG
jgi:cyclic pyranopterin phosphate synthase